MRDLEDDNNHHDYLPNQMVELERSNPALHDKIMKQNVGDTQSIKEWQQNNLKAAQSYLRANRK